MQPGPPYPPQQPGSPQPGPPRQGYPQPGYPQGYQQGYQQPPFAGPPGPRKPRTGLIVLIVVVALALVGGGTTALILLTNGKGSANATGRPGAPAAPAGGRYHKVISCGQLNGGPFTFQNNEQAHTSSWNVDEGCLGQGAGGTALKVDMEVFTTADGAANAKRVVVTSSGQPMNGTGFENAPYLSSLPGDNSCVIDYYRSNEYVTMQFLDLPGTNDAAGCASATLAYAQQYYKIIG